MKKIFVLLTSVFCLSLPALANDIVLIVPNPPGSVSDAIGRNMSVTYKNLTGNNMIVENVSGGFHVPSIVNWKNRKQPSVLMTTGTSQIFNPKLIKDLPYTDADFDHVTLISEIVNAWVVRPDSPYFNMQDLVSGLAKSKKPFVAYPNYSELVNYHQLENKYKWGSKVTTVPYKSVPDVLIGLQEGSVEVAIVSINPTLIGQVTAGKLRVIGQTTSGNLKIGDTTVRSVVDQIGVRQYNGFVGLAVPPTMDQKQAQILKSDLVKVLNDPELRSSLAQKSVTLVNRGPEHVKTHINDYRNAVKNIDLK
jgi:tripartite-type tricarboxylate transporter receptor subunit TctC